MRGGLHGSDFAQQASLARRDQEVPGDEAQPPHRRRALRARLLDSEPTVRDESGLALAQAVA
eukprot:142772-Alexandrium_andersonii.AAC.1